MDKDAIVNQTLSQVISNLVNRTISANKLLNRVKRRARSAPSDLSQEESDTFAPDTILIDSDKVEEAAKSPSVASRSHNSKESFISLDEAMKLTKHEPVKPIKYNFQLPEPSSNVKIPPHGQIHNDSEINLETRKLFVRPANFPTTTVATIKKNKFIKKTVKKDLSRITSITNKSVQHKNVNSS
jgi:hypothetical protein